MTIPSAKKLIAAIVLTIGLFGAGFANAHPTYTGVSNSHPPEPPQNLQVGGITHNTVTVSWNTGHYHNSPSFPNNERLYHYYLTLYTSPLPEIYVPVSAWDYDRFDASVFTCFYRSGTTAWRSIPNCRRVTIPPRGSSLSVAVSGLTPETTYYIQLVGYFSAGDPLNPSPLRGATSTFTTLSQTPTPPEPETPTPPEPETPTTPNPSGCSYKHRLTSVPATTGGGYTSQIVISSEESNATATIRAYQSDNGNQIDVLDSAGNAITGSVSLAPAYSAKRFKLEGIRGWHTVIVEHPSERAMNRATVVMRLREPNGGVSIVPMEGVSDCVTSGTNTE